MATVVRQTVPAVPAVPASVEASVRLTDAEARAIRYLLFSGIGSGTVNQLGLEDLSNALFDAGFSGRGNYPRFNQVAQF